MDGTLVGKSSNQSESSVCEGDVWMTLGYVGYRSHTSNVSIKSFKSTVKLSIPVKIKTNTTLVSESNH